MVLLVYSVIALPGVSVVRFVSAFLDRLDPGGMSNSVIMSQFSGCPGKSRKHRPQVLSVPRPQNLVKFGTSFPSSDCLRS